MYEIYSGVFWFFLPHCHHFFGTSCLWKKVKNTAKRIVLLWVLRWTCVFCLVVYFWYTNVHWNKCQKVCIYHMSVSFPFIHMLVFWQQIFWMRYVVWTPSQHCRILHRRGRRNLFNMKLFYVGVYQKFTDIISFTYATFVKLVKCT